MAGTAHRATSNSGMHVRDCCHGHRQSRSSARLRYPREHGCGSCTSRGGAPAVRQRRGRPSLHAIRRRDRRVQSPGFVQAQARFRGRNGERRAPAFRDSGSLRRNRKRRACRHKCGIWCLHAAGGPLQAPGREIAARRRTKSSPSRRGTADRRDRSVQEAAAPTRCRAPRSRCRSRTIGARRCMRQRISGWRSSALAGAYAPTTERTDSGHDRNAREAIARGRRSVSFLSVTSRRVARPVRCELVRAPALLDLSGLSSVDEPLSEPVEQKNCGLHRRELVHEARRHHLGIVGHVKLQSLGRPRRLVGGPEALDQRRPERRTVGQPSVVHRDLAHALHLD
jgi:hypothetical protein